jgi:hypothetical protein
MNESGNLYCSTYTLTSERSMRNPFVRLSTWKGAKVHTLCVHVFVGFWLNNKVRFKTQFSLMQYCAKISLLNIVNLKVSKGN